MGEVFPALNEKKGVSAQQPVWALRGSGLIDSSGFQEYISLLMVVQSVGNLIIAGNEVNNCEFFPYLFSSLELI
jgi:hypothetical protein